MTLTGLLLNAANCGLPITKMANGSGTLLSLDGTEAAASHMTTLIYDRAEATDLPRGKSRVCYMLEQNDRGWWEEMEKEQGEKG